MSDSKGKKYGSWETVDVLGRGGNATVWRAVASDGEEIALKVINETKPDRESYHRFVREVGFLRDIGPQPGVLPLIESYLPDNPSKSDRAWLAMPIATPIDQALKERSLQEVVAAVASIAQTLARLESQYGVGHRDIKPGNLYELDGEWLVGDFGLISIPGAESLTGDGRQVGPAHFTAYEMILNPSTADPHPADVYSLGKTLWVLATGQRYAPQGNQPAGSGLSVDQFRPHRRAHDLDREIELMTQLRPEDRPSKAQVAKDLKSWLELSAEEPTLDLSAAGARMREKIGKVLDEQDTQERYKTLGTQAARSLQNLASPLNDELKRTFPRTQVDLTTDKKTKNLLKIFLPRGSKIWDWRRCTLVAPLDSPYGLQLRMARALELFADGTLYLHMLVEVAPAISMGSEFHWQPQGRDGVPVGSIEAQELLEVRVREMTAALKQAVEILVDRLRPLPN